MVVARCVLPLLHMHIAQRTCLAKKILALRRCGVAMAVVAWRGEGGGLWHAGHNGAKNKKAWVHSHRPWNEGGWWHCPVARELRHCHARARVTLAAKNCLLELGR